jgi:hypothetical protein
VISAVDDLIARGPIVVDRGKRATVELALLPWGDSVGRDQGYPGSRPSSRTVALIVLIYVSDGRWYKEASVCR